MKLIRKVYEASKGDELGDCISELIRLTFLNVATGEDMEIIHNDRSYHIRKADVVRMMPEKEKRTQDETTDMSGDMAQSAVMSGVKVKIENMKPGTKFHIGSTLCMRVFGLGPTGHVSLVTGAINHAIVQPDDIFEMEAK